MKFWTDEKKRELEELWKDDALTASEIGRRLGCTKNAVIGKRRLLNLPQRGSPIKFGSKSTPKKFRKATDSLRSSNLKTCCWPFDATEGVVFCGEKALKGKPYCSKHYTQAYINSRQMRIDRTAVSP